MMHETPEKNLVHPDAKVALKLQSWSRYKTPNLRVDASLLGAAHSFTHQERTIKVSLPALLEATNAERVTLDHWRGGDGDGQLIPLDYLIHSVDVSVSIPGRHALPSAVREPPVNACESVTEKEQIRLEELATTAGRIALEAFDLWIRCVRWKTGVGRFGQAATVGPETGWGTHLRDVSTGKRDWRSRNFMTSPSRRAVSSGEWESIGKTLTVGQQPPVFVDLLFDAEMHIEAGDFRRAVIDMAVAAETCIRTVVRTSLPRGLGEAAGRLIALGNIRQVLQHLFPEALAVLGKEGYKLSPELHKIFDDRNAIMHSGIVHDLSREKCLSYAMEVRRLIADHIQ